MDFHSLARKELQALCKKNKIPANITNIGMAEALSALEHVEGLDEILDQSKSDLQQSPEKTMMVSDVPGTACRTSTRRKLVREEPGSSQPLTRTRGGARGRVVEEVDQERSGVLKTPAAPSSRRRAPAASARQKEESSVQKVYGTRRSVRLLEKNMEKLSLREDEKPGPLKIDELTREIFSGSSFEKGECMQTSLKVCSEKFEDAEVSSELKDDVQENNNHEDLKSKSELEPEVNLADSGVVMEASEEGSGESDIHLVEKSDKMMDVKDENEDRKGPDDNIVDLKADQIVGTEDSLAAKISDDVSANVMNQAVAAQTPVLQEENKLLGEEECVEPIPTLSSSEMVSGEVKSLASAEDTAKHEGLTLSFSVGKSHVFNSEGCVMNVAENDYHGQFDFEAESITEEESDDGFSEESSDYQSEREFSGENSSEFQETDDEFEVQQRDTTAGDSVSEMDKYNTRELVDIDVIEADITNGSHPLSNGRPGLTKQVPCDMVSGSEVELPSSAANRKNSCHADNEMEEDYGPLLDVYVSVEDFDSAITHETPTSVKKMSPCLGNMTSGGKATGESAFPPNQLSGQFPRPTLSASRKSPIPKRDVVDENEKVEGNEVKKNEGFDGLSMRELKKMLKHKLEIENNKSNIKDKKDAKLNDVQQKVGKTRTALQTLPENRQAINEADK